ncbi:PIF1-like helicase [Phytophthora infestans]|uniref:ATP-dependent DNA helicase n=1 Tax=Phytophthora infestans TaxID=4787 RepID=A0A833TT69_PHYIN|nr:PIF1-like helicase [Phytophthora infestans]
MLSPEQNKSGPSHPVGEDTESGSTSGGLGTGLTDRTERMTCSPDRRDVFDRIIGSDERMGKLRQTLTLLHGGGGTGKSRPMRMITLVLRQHGIDTVNTCPTGVGACHLVNGKTFHSAFKTFRKGNLNLGLLRLTLTENVGLIVIDEASMFCAEFLVLLDQRLWAIYNCDQVFGGRSLLLVGDFLQLEVTGGTPLCKGLYMTTTSDALLSARILFRLFSIYFLETQHRAAACAAQRSNISACRALPSFYPSGQRWTEEDAALFRPMPDAVVAALTNELTARDVENDQDWMDSLTILVTSSADKAILTSCTVQLFAKKQTNAFSLEKAAPAGFT